MRQAESIQSLLSRAKELDKQGQSEQAQRLRERAKRKLRAAINSQAGR